MTIVSIAASGRVTSTTAPATGDAIFAAIRKRLFRGWPWPLILAPDLTVWVDENGDAKSQRRNRVGEAVVGRLASAITPGEVPFVGTMVFTGGTDGMDGTSAAALTEQLAATITELATRYRSWPATTLAVSTDPGRREGRSTTEYTRAGAMTDALIGEQSITTIDGTELTAPNDLKLAWAWAEHQHDADLWALMSYAAKRRTVADALAKLRRAASGNRTT